jgi:hypothetical protein
MSQPQQLYRSATSDAVARRRRRAIIGLASAALLAPMLAVPASAVTVSEPAPQSGLAITGPINPDNGYPLWYEDKGDPANGLAPVRLELCLDPAECPVLLEDPLPNPAEPASFPDNFPGEAFWWMGEALIDNGTQSALLVMAQEAAFGGATEAVVDGEQIAFSRIRIRVDGLQLGETYTVTHPYGVEEFVATDDGNGGGEINFTEDVGCMDFPCTEAGFARAMTGRVGPFLRWDTGAPEGHVGDANIPHTVVGSPYDTNLFRVEGPGANLETNLFTVQGKIAPPSSVFPDVAFDNPFLTEINWMQTNGISTGYPDGTYRPVTPVARDAMAAFIYRLMGSPAFADPATSPFPDVFTDNLFYTEIAWLETQGITEGFPDLGYHPYEPVNRDAMAAFLYRLAGSPDFTAPAVSPFPDVPAGSQFYTEIAWLADQLITTGYTDGTFRPTSPVNRDAMAAFMFRWNALFGTIQDPAAPVDAADPADAADPGDAAAPAEGDAAAPAAPADGDAAAGDGAAADAEVEAEAVTAP